MNGHTPAGIGRPNFELTSDYADPDQQTHWFTIHMRIELEKSASKDEVKELRELLEKSKTDRKDLKKRLKGMIDKKYPTFKDGKSLVGGIMDTPNDVET